MTRRRAKRKALLAGAPLLILSGLCLCLILVWRAQTGLWIGISLGLALGAIIVMRRPNDGVPALMFHSISAQPDWLPWHASICVHPKTFTAQLSLLKHLGYRTLSTAAYLDARRTGASLPKRAVMLHFDDGYLDNWVAAAPLLKAHGLCGTIFISTHFIDPSEKTRPQMTEGADPGSLEWAGYLNWPEIHALEACPHIEIEAHGVDHGRVETSQRIVDHLTRENWKRYAWREWRGLSGDKSRWFEADTPQTAPLGAPIYTNDSALAAPAASEQDARALHQRWTDTADTVQSVFTRELNRRPRLFCWPFNRWREDGHVAMLNAGFEATTAGEGHNCSADDPKRIARIHVQEHAFGVASPALDALYMIATIETFRGRYYWALLTAFANAVRRLRYGARAAPAS